MSNSFRCTATRFFLSGLLLLVFGGLAIPAQAQYYFGKNKVQYTEFDWQVMTTEHFRIYFYEEEAEIARIGAHAAEAAYRDLAAKFNHEVKRTIPLIIYSSPSYFAQTNVTPSLIGEGVGGFTEFMKGRVVVPFHGSYHDFEHVIRHEMVHVFQLDKMDYSASRVANRHFAYPPLWFTEGLAEFWSKNWDTEADMIIKDMVLGGKLFPIENLYVVQGTYFMYKLGESICHFIDSAYGSDKLVQIYDNLPRGRSFEEVVQLTLGDDLPELSRKWQYALRKQYFPELEYDGLPKMESMQVSPNGFSVKGVPIEWNDGTGRRPWVVFMANRMGYTGIYAKEANGTKMHTLIKGERSAKFESLHLLRSGIDANDSGLVVFSSKASDNDRLYIYDLNQRKVIKEFDFPELVAARSPRFSDDARQVVFSGVRKTGFSDLYVLNVQTGEFTAITDDLYYDADPTFSWDGTRIIFASDRCENGQTGSMNIYSVDPASGEMTQMTHGPYKDQTPEIVSNGMYFSSDREGTFNLFFRDPYGNLTKQSTYATGAFDPRISPDGKKLFYTGYQDLGFQVYRMKLPKEPMVVAYQRDTASAPWAPISINKEVADATIKYDTDYSFDIAQSNIAYDPVYGNAGGFQAALSDVLGNKTFYMFTTNTADNKDNFLTSFNLGVTYVNREKRINWGIGAFHLFDEYYNDHDLYYDERQAGIMGLISYPFSKFSRVELSNYARYSKKELRFGRPTREGFLFSNYLSIIYDNSLWDYSGPIEGRRYNFTIGVTNSLSEGRNYARTAFADVRHYFRLGQASAFANRLFAYTSNGVDPQRTYLGGSWSFRGFDRQHWYTRNVLFASNELRFPLINDLHIGLPFGALSFRAIRGALFVDIGSAWNDEFDQFYGSFGAGVRVNLGYLVQLRFDLSRTTDFESISNGTDFDFFFGWNF